MNRCPTLPVAPNTATGIRLSDDTLISFGVESGQWRVEGRERRSFLLSTLRPFTLLSQHHRFCLDFRAAGAAATRARRLRADEVVVDGVDRAAGVPLVNRR